MSAPRVAGVVPAAGSSLRMGRPKALLDAGGRSFVAAVVGSLVGGGCDPVVVVTGVGQPDVRRRAEAAGAVVLENPEPGEGPITSLRLALAALGTGVDAVAVLPVDHPGVRPETVAALLDAFAELLDPGLEGGARAVVHRHLAEATLVDVPDPGILTDIDTPEAYRAAFGDGSDP